MSGIIGGAGSKSGIIGQTEIDYEEGTFNVTAGSNSLYTDPNLCRYVKVGKLCWISGMIRVSSGGHNLILATLPFTSNSDPSGGSGGAWGEVEIYRANVADDTFYCNCLISGNSTDLKLNQNKDDTDTVYIEGETGAYYAFTITYKTK